MGGRNVMVRSRGFTLVELIVVIVVMGIMSFGTVQFILNTSDAYNDAARWERMGSTGRAVIEKMTREARNALPNSVRVGVSTGGVHCLEFIPVLAGSDYIDLPVLAASNSFSSIPFFNEPTLGRVAVYPLDSGDIYDLSVSTAVISPMVTSTASDLVSTAVVSVTMSSNHQFLDESPNKRWFMVDDPVSYCLDGDQLFRYDSYGFATSQPFPDTAGPVTMPTSVPGRQLMAAGASIEGGAPFIVVPATLQRNALVQFDLSFKQDQEGLRISHEVQLRNVP
ncbi:MAG: prepilin-type N-terminal cleavage/methylation domain-containing protein [Motiliproteus sp.]|nr:prepilin-type N-terminal cleavage/methylation domain-containing protein [Motiliproteus sp.]MCW9050885.1 prepilin-type N-terminal cleavage/methylation domain-containing protein [Motiliproteus sp.]